MFNYVPEATSAMLAASEMKSILEREPLIMENGANKVITTHTSEKQVRGIGIHFQAVSVRYPSRPETLSYRGSTSKRMQVKRSLWLGQVGAVKAPFSL